MGFMMEMGFPWESEYPTCKSEGVEMNADGNRNDPSPIPMGKIFSQIFFSVIDMHEAYDDM